MKKVVNFLRGSVEVEAQGAFPERFLNLCAQRGVSFWGVEWVESTAVRLKVPRQERGDLEDLAVRSGCTLSEVERGGLPTFLERFRRRYALLAGLALSLLAVLLMTQFVLVVDVSGNTEVPSATILSTLRRLGVRPGAFGPALEINYIEQRALLELEGYTVLRAYDGLEALDALHTHDAQLMILDVMMPRMDGLSATMQIRKEKNVPILLLSAKTEDADKIAGLAIGADDYITKPYNPMELVARVKAMLRRYLALGTLAGAPARENVVTLGGLSLDLDEKQLTVDGAPVRLTATEYRIVALLMQNPGRVYNAEEIYERVWNEPGFSVENTVMVHIRRIREKIEINPKNPKYLKVVWGLGYKMEKAQ